MGSHDGLKNMIKKQKEYIGNILWLQKEMGSHEGLGLWEAIVA